MAFVLLKRIVILGGGKARERRLPAPPTRDWGKGVRAHPAFIPLPCRNYGYTFAEQKI